MKITIIVLIILLIISYLFINFKTDNKDIKDNNINTKTNINMEKIIKIDTLKKDTFKYFQLTVTAGNGIKAEVSLNDQILANIDNESKQIISNEANQIIKNGDNNINVKINGVTENVDNAIFSDVPLDIIVYAMNTQDFPTENDELIHIKIDSNTLKNNSILGYTFNVSK